MTFKEWMIKVDIEIAKETMGLSHMDIADQTWHDWYDAGMAPQDAAQEALENEGFYDFLMG